MGSKFCDVVVGQAHGDGAAVLRLPVLGGDAPHRRGQRRRPRRSPDAPAVRPADLSSPRRVARHSAHCRSARALVGRGEAGSDAVSLRSCHRVSLLGASFANGAAKAWGAVAATADRHHAANLGDRNAVRAGCTHQQAVGDVAAVPRARWERGLCQVRSAHRVRVRVVGEWTSSRLRTMRCRYRPQPGTVQHRPRRPRQAGSRQGVAAMPKRRRRRTTASWRPRWPRPPTRRRSSRSASRCGTASSWRPTSTCRAKTSAPRQRS